MSRWRRLRAVVVSVVATVAVAGTAAFGAMPTTATAPSFAGAADKPLRAGAAEGLIRVPVGTPLGGYARPPVAGDFLGSDPQGELTDTLPGATADDGTPQVPVADEAR